jgi:zinc protease
MYGDGCRAGRPAEGTLATVAQLTPDMIARFYDDQVRPAATTIVIAGDLTGLDAAKLAEEAFATWRDNRPAGSGALRPDPLPRRQPAAVLVNQPGAVQTQLLLAAPVPGRGHPGWNGGPGPCTLR